MPQDPVGSGMEKALCECLWHLFLVGALTGCFQAADDVLPSRGTPPAVPGGALSTTSGCSLLSCLMGKECELSSRSKEHLASLVVTAGEGDWHLVGRGQGCWWTGTMHRRAPRKNCLAPNVNHDVGERSVLV